ncbi:MAG: hypothetical protein M3171_08640 [Actinomycetota bacterium]|nr:hypothetical protein [Actinomycetota bacterium]
MTVTVTVRPAGVVPVVDDDVAGDDDITGVAGVVPLGLAELVVDEAVALVDAGGAGGVLEEEHAPTLSSATAAVTTAPERRPGIPPMVLAPLSMGRS